MTIDKAVSILHEILNEITDFESVSEKQDYLIDVTKMFKEKADSDDPLITAGWLCMKHPELLFESAVKLMEFCNHHTIRLKECYGDGEIMYPKWKESLKN